MLYCFVSKTICKEDFIQLLQVSFVNKMFQSTKHDYENREGGTEM